MRERVFRLLYCSRNRMQGCEADTRAEITGLLRSARRHNAQAGVTGALFFNTTHFAQVLEGDYAPVLRTFTRAECDPRHAEVVILQCGYAAGRLFGDWAMAYAGAGSGYALPFSNTPGYEAALTGTSRTGEAVLAFLRDVVVQQQVWQLPDRPSMDRGGAATV